MREICRVRHAYSITTLNRISSLSSLVFARIYRYCSPLFHNCKISALTVFYKGVFFMGLKNNHLFRKPECSLWYYHMKSNLSICPTRLVGLGALTQQNLIGLGLLRCLGAEEYLGCHSSGSCPHCPSSQRSMLLKRFGGH
jgi:hypothetical protein